MKQKHDVCITFYDKFLLNISDSFIVIEFVIFFLVKSSFKTFFSGNVHVILIMLNCFRSKFEIMLVLFTWFSSLLIGGAATAALPFFPPLPHPGPPGSRGDFATTGGAALLLMSIGV